MPENAAAINTARRLAIPQGILAGIFTGADVWADLQVADRPIPEPTRCLLRFENRLERQRVGNPLPFSDRGVRLLSRQFCIARLHCCDGDQIRQGGNGGV